MKNLNNRSHRVSKRLRGVLDWVDDEIFGRDNLHYVCEDAAEVIEELQNELNRLQHGLRNLLGEK